MLEYSSLKRSILLFTTIPRFQTAGKTGFRRVSILIWFFVMRYPVSPAFVHALCRGGGGKVRFYDGEVKRREWERVGESGRAWERVGVEKLNTKRSVL